jgi:aspartyl-tRNA(Asn)/glutamyl-tRNA(Gln) amidotransferase subunit A
MLGAMADDLCLLPAIDIARLVRTRQASPVEVTLAVLARAERLQPELNCFVSLCPEQALREAAAAEQAVMDGAPLGPLHGVPFTVKDIVNTKGLRTTFGAVPMKDNVPADDAVSVARLRAAGAILVGKTTTPEFGSKCLTDSPLFGRTRNAWSAERTSGGSSGGAAVAVACGIAPIGVATDGGGSTRIPAAANGVVGIKQSIGVVPHSQAQDLFGNQTYVTPMTRTVADTGLMLQAMAGEHPCDPWSAGAAPQDFTQAARADGDLRGRKILFCSAPQGRPVSRTVQLAFERALAQLASLGAELAPFAGEGFDIEPVWRTINHTVWRTRFAPLVERHGAAFSETFRRQIALAQDFSAVDYQQAMFERSRLFLRVQDLLARADFLVMPTLTRTALPIGQDLFGTIDIDGAAFADVRGHWFPWTMPFNMTGHPAISVPCAIADDGLPVGLQLVAGLRRDADLLRAAALFESAAGLLDRWPPAAAVRP